MDVLYSLLILTVIILIMRVKLLMEELMDGELESIKVNIRAQCMRDNIEITTCMVMEYSSIMMVILMKDSVWIIGSMDLV